MMGVVLKVVIVLLVFLVAPVALALAQMESAKSTMVAKSPRTTRLSRCG